MTTRAERLAAVCDLGYSEQEARFVFLVATHSGHFTLQQYLDFTGTTKGWNVHEFTSKAIRLGHLRVATCAHRTAIYNLYSRKVYGAIDRENLRNRRRLSSELIHTRLLILDFILAHPDYDYLETEADKVVCFTQQFGIPKALLPNRVYSGIEATATTSRYFVDRLPIYVSHSSSGADHRPVPTFVYCEPGSRTLLSFRTHLRNYENLLRRLPAFEFIYACPSPAKFKRAERFFHAIFDESSSSELRSIARYFKLRRLWEEDKHHLLTRADRDFLRHGNERYRDSFTESAYQKWFPKPTENDSLEALLRARRTAQNWRFRTELLPRDYHIFDLEFGAQNGTTDSGPRSASRSDSRSVEENPKQF